MLITYEVLGCFSQGAYIEDISMDSSSKIVSNLKQIILFFPKIIESKRISNAYTKCYVWVSATKTGQVGGSLHYPFKNGISSKYYINIQFIPHRKHITLPML
jgi:hypothetical protein